MKETKLYSIEELAKMAGVTRRTVRFYVQRGVIPPPLGLGRGKHYTEEHLERILKIQALQREGIILDQINDYLQASTAVTPTDFERELVTKIKLSEGIWLEIEDNARMPSLHVLRQLQKILKQTQ